MKKERESDTAPSAPLAPAAVQLGPRKTPYEWAVETGDFRARDPRLPQSADIYSTAFRAAEQLHGWRDDAHNYQGDQAMRLTGLDYRAALEAGLMYPIVPPHIPALSRLVAPKFGVLKGDS